MIRVISVKAKVFIFNKVQVRKLIIYLESLEIKIWNSKLKLLILDAASITIYLFLQEPILLIKKL